MFVIGDNVYGGAKFAVYTAVPLTKRKLLIFAFGVFPPPVHALPIYQPSPFTPVIGHVVAGVGELGLVTSMPFIYILEVEPVNTNATWDHTFNTIAVVDAAAVTQADPLNHPKAGKFPAVFSTVFDVDKLHTSDNVLPAPVNPSERITPPEPIGFIQHSTVNGVVEFAIAY